MLFASLANTFTVSLENELERIEGEGGLLKLHFPNSATNLGTFELTFSKVMGALQTALLLARFKSEFGFEESCLNIEGELKLKPSRMVEIMG